MIKQPNIPKSPKSPPPPRPEVPGPLQVLFRTFPGPSQDPPGTSFRSLRRHSEGPPPGPSPPGIIWAYFGISWAEPTTHHDTPRHSMINQDTPRPTNERHKNERTKELTNQQTKRMNERTNEPTNERLIRSYHGALLSTSRIPKVPHNC